MNSLSFRSRLLYPVVFLLPVVFLFVFVGRFYFARGSTYSDLAITHYPNALWIQRSLLTWGEIPLWSSTILSGYPFVSNPLSGLLYPPGWIALLFPQPAGLNLVMVLHLILGGVGMYFFLRSEGISSIAALLGAIAFEAMPKLVAHVAAGHVTLVYAIAWTPWLLRSVKRGQTGWWKSALCLGLILLADLRWAALAGLFWAAYELYLIQKAETTEAKYALRKIGRMAAVVFLAVILAAVLLLPLKDYVTLSSRSLMTAQDSLALSLSYPQLLGLLVPSLGGSAEYVLYPGGAVLALAVLGLGFAEVRKQSRFWWFVILAGLLFSLGANLPGMDLLVRLPGLNLLRVPPRAYLLSAFGLIVMATRTLDFLLVSPQCLKGLRRINPLLLLVALDFLIIILAFVGWAVTGKFQAGFTLGGSALAVSLALLFMYRAQRISSRDFALLLVGCLIFDLGITNSAGMDFRPVQLVLQHGEAAARFLALQQGPFRIFSPSYSLPQQTAAYYHLELADGVDPLQLLAYNRYMAMASGVPADGYSVTLPAYATGEPASDNQAAHPDAVKLGLLNVGYIAAEFELHEPGLTEVARFDQTRIYQNQRVLPRVWVQDPAAPLGERIVPVTSLVRKPNSLQIQAAGPGLLVLSEITYPGWVVQLDEKPASLSAPLGLLRAIVLPPGEHKILLRFLPTSFLIGAVMSVIAWLVVGRFWLMELRWRR